METYSCEALKMRSERRKKAWYFTCERLHWPVALSGSHLGLIWTQAYTCIIMQTITLLTCTFIVVRAVQWSLSAVAMLVVGQVVGLFCWTPTRSVDGEDRTKFKQ